MELLEGSRTWAECAQTGRYFLSLLTKPEWIYRRVETVELVNREVIDRRTSLDINVAELAARAEHAGFDSPSRVYLPLTLLRKVVLADLDVKDDCGTALSVVTSDHDSHAAHAVLLETAKSIGHDPANFCPEIIQTLYEIARNRPSVADQYAIESSWYRSDPSIAAWGLRQQGLTVTSGDQELWEQLFMNEIFVKRIAELTIKYMPIVAIETNKPQRIIKFRTSEPMVSTLGPSGVRARLGLVPGLYNIDAPSIGRAQREHVRIVAPGGTFLTSATLVTPPSPQRLLQQPTPPVVGNKYIRRITPERAVVYSWISPPGTYQVHFGLRPSIREFRVPALTALILSFLILALGAVGESIGKVLSDISKDRSEPAIALLLVIPTLAVAYIAREGEHAIRAHLLQYMRTLVGVAGFFTLAAAFALILRLNSWIIAGVWATAACYCLIAALIVGFSCQQIELTREKIFRTSHSEEERSVLRYFS